MAVQELFSTLFYRAGCCYTPALFVSSIKGKRSFKVPFKYSKDTLVYSKAAFMRRFISALSFKLELLAFSEASS